VSRPYASEEPDCRSPVVLRGIRRLLRSLAYRTRTRVRRLRPSWHQTSNKTEFDRYPATFRSVADALAHRPPEELRVLSYGCSTGEECLALRKYFPEATIVGTDIDRRNLAVCARNVEDERIVLCRSRASKLLRLQSFDAIFAMSVLCRSSQADGRTSISRIYPFRRFEQAVALLDALLNVDGILVICNANYRFTDTATSAAYESIPVPIFDSSRLVTIFDPHGVRAQDQALP
jgi:Methyltransferase domain